VIANGQVEYVGRERASLVVETVVDRQNLGLGIDGEGSAD